MESIIFIDMMHAVYLTRCLVNLLLERPKKSAIIYTNSKLGMIPAPGSIVYSSTKAFLINFAQGLNYEVKNKIDVMTYNCGDTTTKLMTIEKHGFGIVSPQRASKACFRDLGSNSVTYGVASHEIKARMLLWLPLSFAQRQLYDSAKKVIKEDNKTKTQDDSDDDEGF